MIMKVTNALNLYKQNTHWNISCRNYKYNFFLNLKNLKKKIMVMDNKY